MRSLADAARAATDAQQAAKALTGARELLDAGAIPAREVEAAEADVQRAQAEQSCTHARLTGYGGGAAVDQQDTVRSPLAGVVVERHALPGQEVRPDQGPAALFVVTDPARVWVLFDVPEREAAQVRVGPALDVQLDGAAATPAKVEQVADALDAQTRAHPDLHAAAPRGPHLRADGLPGGVGADRLAGGVAHAGAAAVLQGSDGQAQAWRQRAHDHGQARLHAGARVGARSRHARGGLCAAGTRCESVPCHPAGQ